MRFADIKGNETAVAALRTMVDTGRVPHALMLYENPSSGGLALACAWLQYLACPNRHDGDSCGECPSCRQMSRLIHPDVHFVYPVNTGGVIKSDKPMSDMGIAAFRELFLSNPYFTEAELYSALDIEGKSGGIFVQEAKNILYQLSLSSVTDAHKAVVMFLPERMNPAAANKLLKILEEPPAKTVFVLITQSPGDVMSTIFSRCQGMRVLPFDRSQLVAAGEDPQYRQIWDKLLLNLRARDLLSCLETVDELDALKARDRQRAFCTFASEQLRKIFLTSKGLGDIAYGEAPVPEGISANFCNRALAVLDKASTMIGRNVSAKMVFTDMVNRLFVYMQ